MKRATVSEAELAAVVVAWLEAGGADVYQEVEYRGRIADIVARFPLETWVIETKVTMRLSLIAQAMDWRRDATRVYVAAPSTRHGADARGICHELGIGVLVVHTASTGGGDQGSVLPIVQSLRWNRRPRDLQARLDPEHKTHVRAGSVSGGRWSPWRGTCERLARLVARQPGITLKDAIETIAHHYSSNASARGSLAHWIAKGKIAGVSAERERGKTTLHPTEVA